MSKQQTGFIVNDDNFQFTDNVSEFNLILFWLYYSVNVGIIYKVFCRIFIVIICIIFLVFV